MRVDLSLDYDDEAHYSIHKKKGLKNEMKNKIPLATGKVISVATTLIEVVADEAVYTCTIKGNLKKKGNNKTLIVLGDVVQFDPKQNLIHAIEPRVATLCRKNQLTGQKQILCANVDQVFITVSISKPSLKPSLIDRYLLSALVGNLKPIILINKCDLNEENSENDSLLSSWVETYYKDLGITTLKVSAVTGLGFKTLKKLMQGKVSFFSGQSGVGKTSLINALCDSDFLVQEVHQKTNKGVHTTTSSKLIVFDKNSYCIDSPGIKSFALFDLQTEDIQKHFYDLQRYAENCRYSNCRHMNEENCGVKRALKLGQIEARRFDSYQKLMQEYEQNKGF
jgi:ribosome biogenesis GTPase / thiamine phosphate phosphatase